MAGPVTRIKYLSDDGNTYAVPCPNWQNALAGNPATSAGDLTPPKGFRARYRMLQDTATGREKRVKCHAISSPFWSEVAGSSHTNVDDGTTNGIASAVSAGRIGERQLIR